MLIRIISIYFLFIFANDQCFSQVIFYKIPGQTIFPYKILQPDKSRSYQGEPINTDTIFLQMDAFEISEQITYKEYKKYLLAIKKDSSQQFYDKQLPSFYEANSGILQKYIYSNEFDDRPVIGISYEAAKNYCYWKTTLDFGNDTSFRYSLPKIAVWLAAFNFLDSTKIKNDFNCDFSDWTTSQYYEGGYNLANWHFDVQFEYKENDPPIMKRKRTIGNSYMRRYHQLYPSILNYESALNGSREISFRIVKEKTK